ncbi:MAG: mandelate racemase/muconate lactonizing enzyme family protein [bacterium]
MKIQRVVTKHLAFELDDRFWNSQQRWAKKDIVLVFIETDNGLIGVGEGWTPGASPKALMQTIEEDVGPRLIGQDPRYHTKIFAEVWKTTALNARRGILSIALSAVDLALWDLVGKALQAPVYQLLGAFTDQVPCYASAGLYGKGKDETALAEEMQGYLEQGFSDVKMKVGGVPLEEDVKRVRAVRDAIGPRARLMVDANYTLNVPKSLKMAQAFEPYEIYWLEAPVSPDDVSGQAKVNALSPISVCGNETETGIDRFRELITQRAVEFVQFDIAACGGISEGRRIADLAAAFHLPCTLHASSTGILLAASLHLAASLPNLDSVEYHMFHQWLFDKCPPNAFKPYPRGFVRPPDGPGFGLEIHYDDL